MEIPRQEVHEPPPASLLPQHLRRIHAGGPPCREPGREEGGEDQDARRHCENGRLEGSGRPPEATVHRPSTK